MLLSRPLLGLFFLAHSGRGKIFYDYWHQFQTTAIPRNWMLFLNYFSPPLTHILSYLNFRMMSFWCLKKSKEFYNSLARPFRNREVFFPWNLVVYLWQGKNKHLKQLLFIFISLSLCTEDESIGRHIAQRSVVSRQSRGVTPHLKKLSGNLHFDMFSTWEGSYYREVPRNSTSRWPPAHLSPLKRLYFFLNQNIGWPQWMGEKRADVGLERHSLSQRGLCSLI